VSTFGCEDPVTLSPSCGRELATQITIIFITTDFVSRLLDSAVLPAVSRWHKAKYNGLDEEVMCQAELQFALLQRYCQLGFLSL